MKKIIGGIFLMLITFQLLALDKASLPEDNDALLKLVDFELSRRDDYVLTRTARIDSLQRLIAGDTVGSRRLYLSVGSLYSGLNSDSAIVAFTHGEQAALRAGDTVLAERFVIMRAGELWRLGAMPDAMRDIELLGRNREVFAENRSTYYIVGRNLYLTMGEIFEDSEAGERYKKRGMEFAEKLIANLSPESAEYMISLSLKYLYEKNDPLCLSTLHDLESKIDMNTPQYSLAMTFLGGRYLLLGNVDMAVCFLARAVLADIANGDRQGTALIRLGKALYQSDDIDRANNYLSAALASSLKSGSRTNCIMISNELMPVARTLRARDNRKLMVLSVLIVCLAVAVLMLGWLYFTKRKKIAEMAGVRRMLAEANKAKETGISEFMNLCSSYMESFEEFNRMCRRKISAGQSEDLMQLIKSGKVIEAQRDKFDDIFDDSFISIYPTFVDDVNRLLVPEKRISVSKGVLNTELRVLAFSRLEVDDAAQVARFLGVSNNTVYTYRNKLRNKAASRETFYEDVMRIGRIE